MAFWNSIGNNDHQWVEQPRGRGKDLLPIFLKARFQDGMDFLEEIGAGAGRIDLYLKVGEWTLCGT
jgi:hypothetical protein